MKVKQRLHLSLPRILVLMYHRIDTADTDPWGICVSPDNFEQQINFIASHFTLLSVDDSVNKLERGTLKETSVCVTFDDGYADNFVTAKPVLEQYNCPATFFIPTAFINSTTRFWWDELERIFLHTRDLPAQLTVTIGQQVYNYIIQPRYLTEVQWQQHKVWKWYEETPTERCAVFLQIWELLRPLPHKQIQRVIKDIKQWADVSDPSPGMALPMNEQQLKEIAGSDLFTLGLHTHTHIDLASQTKKVQMEELQENRNLLSHLSGIEVHYAAYPYGRYNSLTQQVAKELKLKGSFTTKATTLQSGCDVTELGRFQASDWNAERFEKEIMRMIK